MQHARELRATARDFENTPFRLPGAVHAACSRNICLPVNSVSHPEFSHSTPHPTIPSGSRRCRERIIPRILLRISHSFIFRVSGAAKVSSEGSFSIILVLLVATSFEFCDSILVAFAMTSWKFTSQYRLLSPSSAKLAAAGLSKTLKYHGVWSQITFVLISCPPP